VRLLTRAQRAERKAREGLGFLNRPEALEPDAVSVDCARKKNHSVGSAPDGYANTFWRENAGGEVLRNAPFFDVQEQKRTSRGDGVTQVVAVRTRASERNSFPLLFVAGGTPVRPDDERLVREMQPVEPAPHCEHLLLQHRGREEERGLGFRV
jgi:hypothetical protein